VSAAVGAAHAEHDVADLVELFEREFFARHRTRLCPGGEEPLYLPHGADGIARIVFRRDYFASALHEIAHWCIAGGARRRHIDYGYWYRPADRDPIAQRRFERAEARPQALEWLLADAAGHPFRISLDDIGADATMKVRLEAAVRSARERLEDQGLPPRAERLRAALMTRFAGRARG